LRKQKHIPQAILLPIGKIHQLDGRCPSMTMPLLLPNKLVFLENHFISQCETLTSHKDHDQALVGGFEPSIFIDFSRQKLV